MTKSELTESSTELTVGHAPLAQGSARALSALLVRVHDMYISGTNCSQPNFFSNQASRRNSTHP